MYATPHKAPMLISHTQFLKNKHGTYLKLCTGGLALPNLVEPYNQEMSFTDYDLGWITPDLVESLHRNDRQILLTGVATTCTTLWTPSEGLWQYSTVHKSRTLEGELSGIGYNQCVSTLYSGWPAFLDRTHNQLVVPKHDPLSAKDLTLLHRFLHGMPRKEMAEKYFVTVKAIEKRLTRLREQLDHHQCRTLHQCLEQLDLIPFLLASANWFDLKPFNRVMRQK